MVSDSGIVLVSGFSDVVTDVVVTIIEVVVVSIVFSSTLDVTSLTSL